MTIRILVFILTFIISSLLTPWLVRVATRFSIVRSPGDGRVRRRAVPLLGGMAVYISFVLSTMLAFSLSRGKILGEYDYHYLGLLLGASVVTVLGVWSDKRKLSFRIKIPVEAGAACILYACGYRLEMISNPFGGQIHPGLWGLPIMIIWVVAVTNALSLIDRLDGVACGVAGIGALTLFFAGFSGPPFVPVLALALAAGCLGFLRYNFYPARIFLGETGSLFFGFVLAALSIQGSFKIAAGLVMLPSLAALGAFLFMRIKGLFSDSRRTEPAADSLGWLTAVIRREYTHKQIVWLIYLLQANLGAIALVIVYAGKTLAMGMFLLLGIMFLLFYRVMNDYRLSVIRLEEENKPPDNSFGKEQSADASAG